MKKDVCVLFPFILISYIFSGCGIIFGGRSYTGSIIVKDHPKAKIYVDGNKIGQWTAIGLFPRNRPLTVEIKQDGCEPKTQTFDRTFRTGNFILTVVTWGLIGILVDVGSGASFKPDHVHNPAILKTDFKSFAFAVDYSGCVNKKVVVGEN